MFERYYVRYEIATKLFWLKDNKAAIQNYIKRNAITKAAIFGCGSYYHYSDLGGGTHTRGVQGYLWGEGKNDRNTRFLRRVFARK